MTKLADNLTRVASIIAAIILLQTLYFKFTAHPDSVHIFSTLGLEPYGRILIGIAELITAVLLLIPRTTALGALMGVGVISGAIISHIFMLGIVVNDDGGLLFTLAMIVFICCELILFFKRNDILFLFRRLTGKI